VLIVDSHWLGARINWQTEVGSSGLVGVYVKAAKWRIHMDALILAARALIHIYAAPGQTGYQRQNGKRAEYPLLPGQSHCSRPLALLYVLRRQMVPSITATEVSVRRVAVFLAAGSEQNRHDEHGNNDWHNNKRGRDAHFEGSLLSTRVANRVSHCGACRAGECI
jgi:hypothetical protein